MALGRFRQRTKAEAPALVSSDADYALDSKQFHWVGSILESLEPGGHHGTCVGLSTPRSGADVAHGLGYCHATDVELGPESSWISGRHVVDHDDCHDGAVGDPHGHDVHDDKPEASGVGSPEFVAHRGLRGGILDGLGNLQHRCERRAVEPARGHIAVADDDKYDANPWRSTANCRRGLPVDASQVRLSRALPHTNVFFDDFLASRPARSTHHGASSWTVLRRVLLGADGTPVRCRRDERAVGGCHHRLRLSGEGGATRRADWPSGWGLAYRGGFVGSVAGLTQDDGLASKE